MEKDLQFRYDQHTDETIGALVNPPARRRTARTERTLGNLAALG